MTLSLFVVALAIFAWSAFYVARVSTRIRRRLEQQHPEALVNVAPSSSSPWIKHFFWQGDFNTVWAALPRLSERNSVEIWRDVVRLKRAVAVSLLSLVVLFGNLVLLSQALRG